MVADSGCEEFGHYVNSCHLSNRSLCVCRRYMEVARFVTWPQRSYIRFSVINNNSMAKAQTGDGATFIVRSQQYKLIMYSCGKVSCNNTATE